jgi:sulfotransferase family protein
MSSPLRRYLPASFKDPVGLAGRLLRSKDPAAYFAMLATGLAVLATPLDWLLAGAERRAYARAHSAERPIILVAGAPRSGTTMLSQALLHNLPISFFNNLTMLFPRSPVVANRLFGRFLGAPERSYTSFYGRTRGFAAPNDGLHIWDRWMGHDRYVVPTRFDDATVRDMRGFFGAWEQMSGRPLLNKNNALATCAPLIAKTLPTAHLIVIRREAAFNVQSIIGAREQIQGSRQIGYGVEDPARQRAGGQGWLEDVCAQVLYHERRIEEQRREIPPERYWVVAYEEICREPHLIVERVGREILGVRVDVDALRKSLPPFRDTNRVKLPAAEFAAIEATLARLSGAQQAGAARA